MEGGSEDRGDFNEVTFEQRVEVRELAKEYSILERKELGQRQRGDGASCSCYRNREEGVWTTTDEA